MKQLTFFLLLLTSCRLFGQDKESSTPDLKRVLIGFNVSPNICYRTLKVNDGSLLSAGIVMSRNENETVKLGYSAGLNMCLNVKRSFGIEAGIQYSNTGFRSKMMILNPLQPDPFVPNKAKSIYNFHYVDIPIKANFTTDEGKIRVFTSLGLTANFFIKETVTRVLVFCDHTDRKTGLTSESDSYNKLNFSPTMSVGIDYRINEKMNLRIEPTFRYGVLKIIDTPVTGYLYSGGINVVYYYGL
jgi:hypothetical protein